MEIRKENGLLNGICIHFDTIRQIKFKITYLKDNIIHEEIIDTVFYLSKNNVVDESPILKICNNFEGEEKEKCRNSEYLRYVYGNIKYPEIAIEEGVEGMVTINFIVNKDGKLTEFIVYRGVCKEIENECLKIIKEFPEWSPGIKDGEPVRVSFSMPINFRL